MPVGTVPIDNFSPVKLAGRDGLRGNITHPVEKQGQQTDPVIMQ